MNNAISSQGSAESYIYVCNAEADKELFSKEVSMLSNAYFKLLIPEEDSSEQLSNERKQEIASCSLFVILLTPESILSEVCLRELAYALETDRPLVTIHEQALEFQESARIRQNGGHEILKYDMAEHDYEHNLLSLVDRIMMNQISPADPEAHLTDVDKSWSIMIAGWFIMIGLIALGLMIWLEY